VDVLISIHCIDRNDASVWCRRADLLVVKDGIIIAMIRSKVEVSERLWAGCEAEENTEDAQQMGV